MTAKRTNWMHRLLHGTKARLLTLQGRFFVIVLFIALCVMALSLSLLYHTSAATIEQITTRYLSEYISYADQSFSEEMNAAKMASLAITVNQKFVQVLMDTDTVEASYEWFRQKVQAEGFLSSVIADKPYILRAILIVDNGDSYCSGGELMRRDETLQIWQAVLGSSTLQVAYDPDNGLIHLYRPIVRGRQTRAVVVLDLDMTVLASAYELQPLEKATLYVYDDEGRMLFTVGEGAGIPQAVSRRSDWELEEASHLQTAYRTVNGERCLVMCCPGSTGLSIVSVVPSGSLISDAMQIDQKILWIVLASLAMTVAASILFSQLLFKSLNTLVETMHRVQQGETGARAQVHGQDEIACAAEIFNGMMDQVEKLMVEIRVQEKEKHKAEQVALEAQIQPHFIYNAISAIQYVAKMHGEHEIDEAACALSQLLRSILGNHNDFITLWEEHAYIEHYMTIQRFKFRSGFTLRWEVADELWAFHIPKLLLQPIVENALIHGIAMRKDGVITVRASRHGQGMLIKVLDNGKGMAQNRILQIMGRQGPAQPSTFRHVGIANVFDRVASVYGPDSACDIFSYPEQFTCVEILLPKEVEN